MIRSMDTLHREQKAVLASYRQASAARSASVRAGSGPSTASAVYGRIASVVGSDETYGPHLVVVRQSWNGLPPVASDASSASVRCYPAPHLTVSDYAVDGYVRIVAATGAMVAERLA